MTMACEASARTMSLSVIPPTRLQEDADRDFVVLELLELLGEGFDRALNVGLEDQVEALELLLGHLAVEVFQRDGLAIGVGERRGRGCGGSRRPRGRGRCRRRRRSSRRRWGRRRGPETSTGVDGPASLDRASLVVEDGADAAEAVAADDHVADAEGSVLDQDGGQHAPALGERRLQAGAGRRPGRVGLELVQLGDRLERGQQLGDALAGRRRGLDDLGVAAPLDGVQPLLRQLAVDLVDVRRRVDVGQVDLVERHHDRHIGRLGVGDGLDASEASRRRRRRRPGRRCR